MIFFFFYHRGVIRDDSIWDRLVFKKVREGLGGRIRFMCTGSAPVAENVLNFFRAALGCVVVEGYGQTECVACCCVTIEGDHTAGIRYNNGEDTGNYCLNKF